jgi:hypothetical protein
MTYIHLRNRKLFTALAVVVAMLASPLILAQPGNNPGQNPGSLPPGLQKQVERGKPLPPGWRNKLQVGSILDRDIYRQGEVLYRDRDRGLVTVRIENKVVRLLESSLEIMAILRDM